MVFVSHKIVRPSASYRLTFLLDFFFRQRFHNSKNENYIKFTQLLYRIFVFEDFTRTLQITLTISVSLNDVLDPFFLP